MEIAIILLVIVIIALSSVMLYREYQSRMSALEARIKKLERANRTRMPWEALEKLENARAALNREKEEREFHLSLIANAEAWLDQVAATGTKRETLPGKRDDQ